MGKIEEREGVIVPMVKQKDPEKTLLKAGLLLDTYGGLLTERQRQFTRLHFEEDLSFSEIAREFGISRQAVHDAVKHAVQTLERLESHLGLVEAANEGWPGAGHIGGRQLIERLSSLRQRVMENPSSESGQWIVQELDSLIALLEGDRRGQDSPVEREAS